MNIENTTVTDSRGTVLPALLMVCPNCGGKTFLLIIIPQHETGGHNHLQCATCDESYCQGNCDKML